MLPIIKANILSRCLARREYIYIPPLPPCFQKLIIIKPQAGSEMRAKQVANSLKGPGTDVLKEALALRSA